MDQNIKKGLLKVSSHNVHTFAGNPNNGSGAISSKEKVFRPLSYNSSLFLSLKKANISLLGQTNAVFSKGMNCPLIKQSIGKKSSEVKFGF